MTRQIVDDIGLPPPVVDAFESFLLGSNDYEPDEGEHRASALVNPALLDALRREHKHEIVQRASDSLYLLKGLAMHAILERVRPGSGDFVERHLTAKVAGRTLRGTLDYYHHETASIWDWKTSGVWKVLKAAKRGPQEGTPDWCWQGRMYALLARANGLPVASVNILAFTWDWREGEARNANDYPELQVTVVPVPLVSDEETEAWVAARMDQHDAARAGDRTVCSPADRWARESAWAVKKRGNKRATVVFDTRAEAEAEAAALYEKKLKQYDVEERPGDQWMRCRPRVIRGVTRCYCPVSQWCPHFTAAQAAETVTLRGEDLTIGVGGMD